jgi:hypothetical protein
MKKRMLLFFAVALMSAAAFSQGFGVRAGVNLQTVNGKDDAGKKLENDMTIGFHAGVNYEISIAEGFYLQPGLNFSTKGAKETFESFTTTYNLNYLELPIHLVYKPQLGSGKLIVGFGPYLGYGLMGKVKPEEGSDKDIKFKQGDLSDAEIMDMATGEKLYLKGLDAGADIFFGYEFAFKLSVQFNAQLGLLSMYPSYNGDDQDESIMKNTGFGVSLGYRF